MQEKDYSIFDRQCLLQNGPLLTTAIVRRIRFQHLRWPLFISKCTNIFNGQTSSQKIPEFMMAIVCRKRYMVANFLRFEQYFRRNVFSIYDGSLPSKQNIFRRFVGNIAFLTRLFPTTVDGYLPLQKIFNDGLSYFNDKHRPTLKSLFLVVIRA